MQTIDGDLWLRGGIMGRRKRTKMIVRDVKVDQGKCIVSVEIRRGSNAWVKAYGFNADQLKEGEFTLFQDSFKARVLQDALQLEEDKHFEERVLMRLEDMKGQVVFLD